MCKLKLFGGILKIGGIRTKMFIEIYKHFFRKRAKIRRIWAYIEKCYSWIWVHLRVLVKKKIYCGGILFFSFSRKLAIFGTIWLPYRPGQVEAVNPIFFVFQPTGRCPLSVGWLKIQTNESLFKIFWLILYRSIHVLINVAAGGN